ncbi:MAG TPA: nuclear transport factor 2 family protein [Kofleriaceae bacterium]|nr:nuclear transport factor 2 family protein [Kofleriaceae bacterium]
MTRGDRTIILALVATVAACAGTKKEVETAKHSLYDTDFASVYSAAVEATRELYPNLDDNPGPGKIQTAWHQVAYADQGNDPTSQAVTMGGGGAMGGALGPGGGMAGMGNSPAATGMPTQLTTKRYYVRFDVTITGGRPWRLKVNGHASEWDPGAAMPVEMKGANKPPWLQPRIDALTLAIHKRIQKFAVPMKEDAPKSADDELPRTDPRTFKGVPPAAARQLAQLKDVLARRDYAALRPLLDDNVVWSLGGGTGADAALAMWQADPAQLDAMAGLLAACAADGDKKVTCPAGAAEAGAYQLVLEPRADAWRITSFVKAE